MILTKKVIIVHNFLQQAKNPVNSYLNNTNVKYLWIGKTRTQATSYKTHLYQINLLKQH